MSSPPIRRAILSVSDKQGLAELARGLAAAGVEMYSTGGTRAALEKEGFAVRDVAAYTGFPEMMDGRLKTLHPKIFGGILCRHDRADDRGALERHGISTFELVVVNLYPFETTIARAGTTFPEAIEQIDIGGPSLVRAAAKNHAFTTIVTRPDQYAAVLGEIAAHGATTPATRFRLAAAAFEMTARYDRAIADYFAGSPGPCGPQPGGPSDTAPAGTRPATTGSDAGGPQESEFPAAIDLRLTRLEQLRYGENPHQRAAVYALSGGQPAGIVGARKLHGKELSYNNLLDLDSALTIARSLPDCGATVLKHNNPCGAASADTLSLAAQRALDGDPQSAFGGILGFNRPVDAATAEVLAQPGLFIEAIVAPRFEAAALTILTARPKWKENVRLLEVADWDNPPGGPEYRAVAGGFLVQDPDREADPEAEWKVVTERQPTVEQLADLRFAWTVVRHVKSNAIVVCRERALLGAGAGQMSRVDSVEIAIQKAGERSRGSVLASDAFFPFPDSIERAAAAGIAAIIQPGGSRKDPEVIVAANHHGLAMIFTGRRHFRH